MTYSTDPQTMDTTTSPKSIRNPSVSHSSRNGHSNPASCELCRRRKIKCDRSVPCGGCAKAGVECVPVLRSKLPRGRRGGRKPRADGALLERITKLESLVKDFEAQDERPSGNAQTNQVNNVDEAQKDGEYTGVQGQPTAEPLDRYLGTSFWVTLSQEISGLKEVLDDSSTDEDDGETNDLESNPSLQSEQPQASHSGFIISPKTSIPDIMSPTRHQMYIFCDVYLSNVDPVFKVLHAPSLRKHLQEGSAELDCSPGARGLEALRFSIFYAATISISDGECMYRVGEDRSVLLARYRAATELALAKSDFVNTVDLSTLQALAIYLVTVRAHDSTRFMWTLISLAIRIAQAIGLHLDGKFSSHRPLEREMRRRLWWQICALDSHAADDRASAPMVSAESFNTPFPMSINDQDLSLDSSEPVQIHEGFTDMTFCLICCEVFDTVRQLNYVPARELALTHSSYQENWKQRIGTVINLQRHIEDRYLRHLDLARPLHWASRLIADLIMAGMWLIVYRPLQRRSTATTQSQIADPGILRLSVEVLEKAHQLNIDPASSNFRWISQTYVQWHALAVTVAELCVKTEGPIVEKAWAIVELTFSNFSKHVADSNRGMLWRPIKKLMKKALELRQTHLNSTLIRAVSSATGTIFDGSEHGSVNMPSFSDYGQRSLGNAPFSSQGLQEGQTPSMLPAESFEWSSWLSAASTDQNQINNDVDHLAWSNWEDFVGGFQF